MSIYPTVPVALGGTRGECRIDLVAGSFGLGAHTVGTGDVEKEPLSAYRRNLFVSENLTDRFVQNGFTTPVQEDVFRYLIDRNIINVVAYSENTSASLEYELQKDWSPAMKTELQKYPHYTTLRAFWLTVRARKIMPSAASRTTLVRLPAAGFGVRSARWPAG